MNPYEIMDENGNSKFTGRPMTQFPQDFRTKQQVKKRARAIAGRKQNKRIRAIQRCK